MRIDDLPTIAVPEQPALSPDGSQCLYVLRTSDPGQDRNLRSIWRVGLRPGTAAKSGQRSWCRRSKRRSWVTRLGREAGMNRIWHGGGKPQDFI